MKVVFQDPTFSLQLLRAIAETYNKGADIGECLSTAYRIREGDFESWYIEWLKTAKRVHKYADECLASGHDISAREACVPQIIIELLSFSLSIQKIQEFRLHEE
ncbi:MAG: hypothetical protein WAZ77_21245 [Candidatus Nitrosopolaris sp.]|jgi:hypothetical protein